MTEYTDEQLNSCGIYCITCVANGKRYVGQSINIGKRWDEHKRALNNNTHRNGYLQKAWNKYGNQCFIFDVIEVCPSHIIDEAEVFWIYTFRTLNRKHGYNLVSGGANGRPSEETKLKLSKALRGKFLGDKSYWFGKTHSSEVIAMAVIYGQPGVKKLNNTTGYTGVSKINRSKTDKWEATIRFNGKTKHLGRFTDLILAAKAYDAASFAHYGRTDILNFPEDYTATA